MIYLIIYLIGCIVSCCTLIMICIREDDFLVRYLPILAIYTIGSWISMVVICVHYLYNYISTNVNGDKVLIKRKNI